MLYSVLSGTLDEMIPDNQKIVDEIKQQLIDKVIKSKKLRDSSMQTEPASRPQSARSVETVPNLVPFPLARDVNPYGVPMPGVPLGRDDLDPLGGFNPLRGPGGFPLPGFDGGGGMLFRPPGPGNFPGGGSLGVPPGSLPPGARFDPFRPPDTDRFTPRRPPNRPDNDELPPPGYDDMFM